MSKSVIYVVNSSTQTIADGGTVALGSVVHRYGCNLSLSGNTILASGCGYYDIDCTVIAAPTTAGTITATLYSNGVKIPGATSSFTASEADDVVTLTMTPTFRVRCACLDPLAITCVLTGVESTVTNVSLRVVKS